MLAIITAYDRNKGIGKDNSLPWRLADDLKLFRQLTQKNTVIMGRKTYHAIGHALPNRHNIVLTRDQTFQANDCLIARSIDELLSLIESRSHHLFFIIGGGEVYQQFLPYVDRLYISEINADCHADTFFPEWDQADFQQLGQRFYSANQDNEYDFTFRVWERKN